MSPHLESYLWDRIDSQRTPREAINEMLTLGLIESPKQAWATLEKWARKRPFLYEYGVALDLGWKVNH